MSISKRVCIVIPVYKNLNGLTSWERISLAQCFKVLKNYQVYFTGPDTIDFNQYLEEFASGNIRIEALPFNSRYFENIGEYSRLLLSPFFYKAFLSFEYLLIYQTDAFVFRDELELWCQRNYDYIGAPWFENFNSIENVGDFIGVGNGGFSLRKVESHLKVLNTFSYVTSLKENWQIRTREAGKSLLHQVGGILLDYTIRNNTHWLLNTYGGHEDQFWGLTVSKKINWFKVPAYEQATAFAFEMQPRRLLQFNNNQLPFGCHAWWKYDLEFWRPYIEQFGYKL